MFLGDHLMEDGSLSSYFVLFLKHDLYALKIGTISPQNILKLHDITD